MKGYLWRAIRKILFLFDAESVHESVQRLLRFSIRFGNIPFILITGQKVTPSSGQNLHLFGMDFSSRLGLAAGFDRNAEILDCLPPLGFGFVEVGGVTPRPQVGNPRPRLFRDVSRGALFNRMGFNGDGAVAVSSNLARVRDQLPPNFRVGINMAKNRETPADRAADDYVMVAKSFEGLADFLVINVSSPNTPGLRDLQTVEALERIVGGVMELISRWKKKTPLLLKLASELNAQQLEDLVPSLERRGIDGWVLTNTLLGTFKNDSEVLSGGWSGKPLVENSRRSLETVRALTRKPIISVGGIYSEEEARERLKRGADLLQIYTGWVYEGPGFPARVSKAIQNWEKPAILG